VEAQDVGRLGRALAPILMFAPPAKARHRAVELGDLIEVACLN
jgi:hypothetical protein